MSRKTAEMPKPDLVKRMTSNQNETDETKPDFDGHSVKRAALNREGSLASNRLKEKYMPGYFDSKKEVDLLSTNLQQSTLDTTSKKAAAPGPKPSFISQEDRMTTLDMAALDLVVNRPVTLGLTSRSTTIDALSLDFEDPFLKTSQADMFGSVFGGGGEMKEDAMTSSVPKPPALTEQGRLTTNDMFDIVNEPLGNV